MKGENKYRVYVPGGGAHEGTRLIVKNDKLSTTFFKPQLNVVLLVLAVVVGGSIIIAWPLLRKEEVEEARLSQKKRCVFLHGMGYEFDDAVDDDFTAYWGPVKSWTRHNCGSHEFMKRDTVSRNWTNHHLQDFVCDLIRGDIGVGEDSIANSRSAAPAKDVIIFAHSMGNNILGGALANGRCELDTTASWYAINAPWRGTKAANYAVERCAAMAESDSTAASDEALLWVSLGFCKRSSGEGSTQQGGQASAAIKALVIQSTADSDLKYLYSTAEDAARQHVSGVMCGTSALGLASVYSMALKSLSESVEFDGPNDGVVETSSCEGPWEEFKRGKGREGRHVIFKENPRHTWYSAAVNHLDGSCRDGNGDWGKDRQPCRWYRHRT